MELDKEVFLGKNISEVIKELYEKQTQKSSKIQEEIERLTSLIESPGDAIVLIPHIKGLLDTSIKNDETLLKIAQLFKQASDNKKSSEGDNGVLTDKDIAQLFEEAANISSSKGNNYLK